MGTRQKMYVWYLFKKKRRTKRNKNTNLSRALSSKQKRPSGFYGRRSNSGYAILTQAFHFRFTLIVLVIGFLTAFSFTSSLLSLFRTIRATILVVCLHWQRVCRQRERQSVLSHARSLLILWLLWAHIRSL